MLEPPIVDTTHGRLRGVSADGLSVFLGIPYAAPPTGILRWQQARPRRAWGGVRDAVGYAVSAPQPYLPGGGPTTGPIVGEHGAPPFGEDCLTLNVWTPGIDNSRRPVLVGIHGGGFLTGSGNIAQYAGDRFARDGDLVVVTISYRLGPLGFLEGMGPTANLWLGDQAAALHWVADNIAAFGGNPDAVTVAGQSGGGLSIGALAQHPTARTLFRRAIVQSAPFGLRFHTPEQAFERTRSLARILGHSDTEALREESADRLIEGTMGVLAQCTRFGQWPLAFLPALDRATMPRHPVEALADSDLDLLIGWTEDEATFAFVTDPRYDLLDRAPVIEWLGRRYVDPETVYDTYSSAISDASPRAVLAACYGDELFRRDAVELLKRRTGLAATYAYQFELDSPAFDGALGATHCLDLPFAFANADRWAPAEFLRGLAPAVVERVSTAMHRAWIAFIRDGDPSHTDLDWPTYPEGGRMAIFDDEITVDSRTSETVTWGGGR